MGRHARDAQLWQELERVDKELIDAQMKIADATFSLKRLKETALRRSVSPPPV